MPGIKFDGRKLRDLQRRMQRLSSRKAKQELNRELAQDAMVLLERGFATGTDPYGRRWPKPKHRKGVPMRDTGRLRAAWSTRSTAAGYYLSNRTGYASYLQGGTRFMKARRMVPGDRSAPRWNKRFRSTHQRFVRRTMGRR